VAGLSDDERELYETEIVGTFAEICFVLSVTHKHTAFKDEREWRFIWNKKQWSPPEISDSVVAKRTAAGLLERLVLPVGENPSSQHDDQVRLDEALKQVMIGPCEHRYLKARGVHQLLRDNGLLNTTTRYSEIPFRS